MRSAQDKNAMDFAELFCHDAMMEKVLFHFIFVSCLFFLPGKFWRWAEKFCKKIQTHLLYKNPAKQAQLLIEKLGQLDVPEWFQREAGPLPLYKFFTSLIKSILQYGRNFGAPVGKILQNLRQGMIKDRQFEIKFVDERRGALAQFFLVTCITWTFLLICRQMVDVKTPLVYQGTIAGLQILGTCIYLGGVVFLRRKLFYPFPPYIFTLTTLQALSQAEIPLGLILKKSKLQDLINGPPLCHIHGAVETLIDDWQTRGSPVQGRLKDLLEETWFLQEMRFDLFLKTSKLLKFFCLAVFFLSSYLLYLYSLFSFFLQ